MAYINVDSECVTAYTVCIGSEDRHVPGDVHGAKAGEGKSRA